MRARPKKRVTKEQINSIDDIELKQIGFKYFIQKMCELDIAFELNLSEKTISRRIKEIYQTIE